MAVLKVVSDIRGAVDLDSVSLLLLLLDMSAAFDTVDHGILINRFEKSFGVHQAALGWVRSYLTGRKQTILSTGGHDTVTEGISTGVRQGSVLGSILFSLYVTDIEQLVR